MDKLKKKLIEIIFLFTATFTVVLPVRWLA